MLLFMRPQDVDTVRDILCYHARITDSEELQSEKALKARFHVEAIDPAKGSATGYIAKYISKILMVLRWMVSRTKKPAKTCVIWLSPYPRGLHAGVFASFSRLVVRR